MTYVITITTKEYEQCENEKTKAGAGEATTSPWHRHGGRRGGHGRGEGRGGPFPGPGFRGSGGWMGYGDPRWLGMRPTRARRPSAPPPWRCWPRTR